METEIRNALLDAEMNEHYYRRLAQRAERADRATRIVSLMASSGAVATALRSVGDLWVTGFAAVASVASIVGLVSGYGEQARRRRELAALWSKLYAKLRAVERGGHKHRIADALAEREELEAEDTEPRDDKLARSIQEAMIEKQSSAHHATAAT